MDESTNRIIEGEPIKLGEPSIGSQGSDSGIEGDVIPIVNPAEIGDTSSGDGEPRKKRGRPYGSKNRISGTTKKEASQDLSSILLSVHLMLASLTKVQELKLDKEEAKELSDAIVRVNDLYGGFVLPEKVMAWVNLGIVGIGVYSPRYFAYSIRVDKERKEKQQASTIVQTWPEKVV